jgi:calmodulin
MIHLSEEDLAEFREIFDLVDTDGSGEISPEELGQLCTKLGLQFTQSQLDDMVAEIDQDRNGEIDFDEFVAVLSKQAKPAANTADLKKAFEVFADPSERNVVLVADLERAILEHARGTNASTIRTPARVRQLMDVLDPGRTGRVEYADFVNIMSF